MFLLDSTSIDTEIILCIIMLKISTVYIPVLPTRKLRLQEINEPPRTHTVKMWQDHDLNVGEDGHGAGPQNVTWAMTQVPTLRRIQLNALFVYLSLNLGL